LLLFLTAALPQTPIKGRLALDNPVLPCGKFLDFCGVLGILGGALVRRPVTVAGVEVAEEVDGAIEVLDECGGAFDPVAGVEVIDLADLADDGPVDVAADDAGDVVLRGVADDGFLEFADEGDGVFDALLGVGAEGPVAEAEVAADPVEGLVGLEEEFVADVADEGEPAHVLDDGVELVAVHDEEAAAICGEVDVVFPHGDGAEVAHEAGEEFVVIAGDVDDAGAFAAFAKELLDDV
jgi:hypothetical protein